jgi:hypothetical protein
MQALAGRGYAGHTDQNNAQVPGDARLEVVAPWVRSRTFHLVLVRFVQIRLSGFTEVLD